MSVLFHFNLKNCVFFFYSFPSHQSTFSKEKKKKLCTYLDVLYVLEKCDKVGRKEQSMIPGVS